MLSEKGKKEMQELLFELEKVIHDTPLPNTYYGWVDDLDNVMGAMHKKYLPYYERLNDLVVELQRIAKEHMIDIEDELRVTEAMHSSEGYFRQMSYVVSELRGLKSLVL
ncbi:hypothetical protein COB21_04745 [Candidatus Aerophobetes bacterium]|uniref:Uncharacterized protein n=1 Tax=Aerophobetes bacterium TaxID=2030807 RepID=A0A2A4X0H0_UNCAE|nr:MAG: hypothetical protein COB21_04745 [Candidatus Aerophobetes bacterium]